MLVSPRVLLLVVLLLVALLVVRQSCVQRTWN
jgi:hypothetical protein